MSRFYRAFCLCITILLVLAGIPSAAHAVEATPVVYYVSSSMGNDGNNGLSEATAFKTITKVNALNLLAGDRVLFKCGDTWRGVMLTIVKSGAAGLPITFGSYPAGCVNKPILSGAQPIAGWSVYSGNIYVATLNAGANAGKFGYGINQLFRDSTRLTMGRWPNIGAADGGYATIEASPAANQITDNQLPALNWAGAVAHIRGMRWYILNRQVMARAGQTLTLGSNTDCWGGNCTGWGYFLNNSLATLDTDGEWYYNSATHQVYLYSTSGAPADGQVEGSVILKNDDRSWGGITLGADLTGQGIAYVTIQNLDVRRWFRSGIATPTNFANYEPHHLVIQSNSISDADAMGINLAAWVYSASDGRPDGWRGGYGLVVSANSIRNVNSMGINLYSRNSTFNNNIIQDVGIIQNLGAAGMGCAFDSGGGSCTEDGDGLRVKVDKTADTGNTNTIQGNHLERIAHNGMDIFGHTNTIKNNVIKQACIAKGDCGGVRTFGRDNLASSPVHDLTFDGNIIVDTLGNTDGCRSDFDALFGFGLYIDNYSRNIAVTGNTIIDSTVHGILFQNSTGTVTGNTLYNNGRTYPYGGAQVYLGSAPASISNHANNILYSLNPTAWTLALSDPTRLGTSNANLFFSPYDPKQISASGDKTLTQWKSFSGKDAASTENWFTLAAGDPPNSTIFYNETGTVKNINLGTMVYKDLSQNLVSGTLTLQPYQSRILVVYGDTSAMPPVVLSIKRAHPNPTTLATVNFTVTFSEAVTGVDASDFSLTTGSGITGAIIDTVSGSGASYTVSVGTGSGSGKIQLNALDDDSIMDLDSNPLGGTFTGGDSYIVRPVAQTFYSSAAQDGWVLESSETSNKGGTLNATTATFQLGDDAQKRQYKAILSFDTSALPDNATLISARMNIRQNTLVGKNPFTKLGLLWVDLAKPAFGTPVLTIADFQVAATLKQVGAFGATPAAGWYSAPLNAQSWTMLNKVGRTEFRLYFALDDNNDKVADFMRFNSGNAAAGKPELVIQYILP